MLGSLIRVCCFVISEEAKELESNEKEASFVPEARFLFALNIVS
jgi:hypothetical protein